jgi:hypothetical protein
MKKIAITTIAFLAAAVITTQYSCTKVLSCIDLVKDVSSAASKFGSDSTAANCKEYKAALQSWLDNSSCTGADPTLKTEYQGIIDSLNCP